jgi:hypothetical protein
MPPDAFMDRQLPAGDEIFLDHVGYFVADLEHAGARLERLGFQVSKINVQTNADASGILAPSGTSNRLARLRRGYLEILAATHDTPLAEQFRNAIARYEGLHLIAMAHDDIPAQRERLIAAGFAMQPMVHLKRRDKTLRGEPEVAWHVLRPEAGVMAEGRVQFTKSHTPDVVWQDDLIVHANAADALTDLLLVPRDIGEATARFARYTSRRPRISGDLTSLDLDRGRLVFVTAEKAATLLPQYKPASLPYMAGQAIRTADIATTERVVRDRGIEPLAASGDLILLGPHDALGSFMLFHAPHVSAPWETLANLR